MSSNKKPDANRARLAALKKLGLLKSIPARGELSDAQKKKIRTEFKKYHDIANAAPGQYKVQSAKALSDSDKKKLKDSGYKIVADKVYLPTQGYDSASIKQVWVRNKKTGLKEKTLVVTRKKGDRKIEQEYIGKPIEKMQWRDRLLDEYQAGKFKDGDYVGVKLFDNGRFERQTVMSIDVLFRYLEDKKNWHDRDEQKLYDNLHLVKITVHRFSDLADDDSRKARDHAKYIASKNRKKTKTLSVTNPEKLKQIKQKQANRKGTPTKITGRRKK